MTLLAATPSAGFQNAVYIYIVAAVLSFAVAASLFWKKRRFTGRHVPAALVLACLVAAMQGVFVLALTRIPHSTYERDYFREVLLASGVILLPAFFISTFVMVASGAWLSELAGTPPFPISRGIANGTPGTSRAATISALIALVAATVAILYSIALFKLCERVTGQLPQPAPGTEEVAGIFTGNSVAILGFGLAAAFWEEIFVRLFLLSALRRIFRKAQGADVAAIVVASAIWATGHAGTMNPELIKFMQVFIVGILLGVIQIRRGIETCLASHGAFNVGILVIGGFQ